MKNLSPTALLSLLLAFAAHPVRAQQDQQKQDSQKKAEDQPQESSSKKNLPDPDIESEAKPGEKPEDKSRKAADKYDPYPAQKDLEVGMFYLHKGNVDAAIDRFKDAIELRPNFAKPRLLIAEAYERKGEKAEALKYYKEYLQVFPNAPDAKSVRKKIEKLSGQ